MCSAAGVVVLARTVLKPECCVNLILQQMEEEQYPGQYWQGRQQREQNGAEWVGWGGGGLSKIDESRSCDGRL